MISTTNIISIIGSFISLLLIIIGYLVVKLINRIESSIELGIESNEENKALLNTHKEELITQRFSINNLSEKVELHDDRLETLEKENGEIKKDVMQVKTFCDITHKK